MAEARSMAPHRPYLGEVVVKTMVTHPATYFLIGLAAFWSFGYTREFAEPGVRSLMRQTDEPPVMAGPLFQPIRGLLFVAFSSEFGLEISPADLDREDWATPRKIISDVERKVSA
jgi:hypothetical protein